MHLHQSQLAVWNAEKTWAVEPGYYTVWVGGSSEAALTTRFLLKP
jgi:beta-glucosidase